MRATLAQRSSAKAITGWALAIVVLGLLDLHRSTMRDGSTLSECLRQVLRTDTPTGRAVFLLGLVTFARHILH